MAKKYYKGWITLPMEDYLPRVTEKAIMVTVGNGVTGLNDYNIWIPKSILKIDEPNELGNASVYLPVWYVAKKQMFDEVRRIREFDFCEIVEM